MYVGYGVCCPHSPHWKPKLTCQLQPQGHHRHPQESVHSSLWRSDPKRCSSWPAQVVGFWVSALKLSEASSDPTLPIAPPLLFPTICPLPSFPPSLWFQTRVCFWVKIWGRGTLTSAGGPIFVLREHGHSGEQCALLECNAVVVSALSELLLDFWGPGGRQKAERRLEADVYRLGSLFQSTEGQTLSHRKVSMWGRLAVAPYKDGVRMLFHP